MRVKSVLYFTMHEKRSLCYKTHCRQPQLHTHVAQTVNEVFKKLFEETIGNNCLLNTFFSMLSYV